MSRTATIRRLLALARPEAPRLAIATGALLVAAGLNLSYPLLIRGLVDGVSGGIGQPAVNRAAAMLLGLFGLAGAATAVRSYLFTAAGERVVARLRERLFRSLLRQDIAFFDEARTGELTSRLASDTTVLQNAVTVNLSMALRYVVTGLGAIAILFVTSWKLTALMLSTVPVAVFGIRAYGRMLRDLSKQVQDAAARSTEVAEEALSGIRTVRAFAREDAEAARYAQRVDAFYALARQRARLGGLFAGGATAVAGAAVAGVLWYGGTLLNRGELSLGDLTSFVLYTFFVAFSLGALGSVWEDLMKALGASARVWELIDRLPAIRPGGTKLPDLRGEIRLTDISFSYPSRPDVAVLRDVSLALSPGETVALVGPSGGGKSTVAALLARFYDPVSGRLTLDGVSYAELDPDWLREQIGSVSQEPVLFATSIADNIRYGRPGAGDADVEGVARAAFAHDFVSAFPDGYATLVGERGVRLSGGQKQRIAIARALLKDPRVLVLDEATSALDAESEHLVQQALDRLRRGRTTLVIAHRLSTVRDADRVVVIEGGRVVESGDHESLWAKDGAYRALVQRQFAGARLETASVAPA